VFISAAGDTSWAAADSGLTNRNVTAISSVGSTLFAGTLGGGMFLSTDAGVSWAPDDSGLAPLTINALIAVQTNVFAGTDAGVFRSTDMGRSWSHVDTLLGTEPVYAFGVTANYLFVGTNEFGIWRRPLKEIVITGIASGAAGLPGVFRLDQNYPNPFNPSTTIRYTIPGRSRVTLTLYNILGQHVATLIDAEQDAGLHSVRYDGSGVSSGVYFYRLSAGGSTAVKRLLLLR
jgi:hypothetical protein